MSRAIKSECSVCGATFVSVAAFDIHRVGSYLPRSRRCMTVNEMQAEGLIQDDKGWWGFDPAQSRPSQTDLATCYSQAGRQQKGSVSR